MLDHGFACNVDDVGAGNPVVTEDATHRPFWGGLAAHYRTDPTIDDDEIDEDEINPNGSDDEDGIGYPTHEELAICDAVSRFRRAQIRAIRRVLVGQLPCAVTDWIVHMRFPWLTFADIARLWKYFEEARAVANDNIKLLPVWLWSGINLVAQQDWDEYWKPGTPQPYAVRSLRKRLRQRRIPPRIWRMLCRYGPRIFPAAITNMEGSKRYRDVRAYLKLIASDNSWKILSTAQKYVLWTLAEHVHPAAWRMPDLLRAAVQHVHQRITNGDVFDGLRMVMVINHFCFEPPSPHAIPRGAGWNWWLRQYEPIEARRLADYETTAIWPSVIDAYRTGAYVVEPLNSRSALREEGKRMRHCVASYGRDCASNRLQIYSIRDAESSKSLATVALKFEDEALFVHETAGFAILLPRFGTGHRRIVESLPQASALDLNNLSDLHQDADELIIDCQMRDGTAPSPMGRMRKTNLWTR